jgi:hypothetical protein
VGSRRPLIVLFVVAASCGTKSPANKVDQALDALEAFKDRGCACADQACFGKVQGEMEAWARAHAQEINGATATKAQGARAETIDRAMIECQEKFGVTTDNHERAQQMVRELRGFQIQFCACPDIECIATTDAAMKQWAQSRADELKKLKPTKAQDDEAATIERQIKECITRIQASPPLSPTDAGTTP